jgi:hypothetical protein
VLIAFLYAGYVIGSRWWENRQLERTEREREAQANQAIVEQYGDGELKILTFYANPPALQAGQAGLLCYGVANAADVRIEPALDGVGPALTRCLEVRPTRSTTYTLRATGRDGKTDTRQVEVTVR